jgi:hypothetical protein
MARAPADEVTNAGAEREDSPGGERARGGLSYGERGESAKLWGEPGMTRERVEQSRHQEAQAGADILGGRLVTHDAGDEEGGEGAGGPRLRRSALPRTTRLRFDGSGHVPASVWDGRRGRPEPDGRPGGAPAR